MTKATIAPTEEPIVSNISRGKYAPLIDELKQINARWQKAAILDDAGEFLKMPPKRLARIEAEVSAMVNRAVIIWETIKAEAPELIELESLVFLEDGQ